MGAISHNWKVVIRSTIFQKYIVAITGLGLAGFVLSHMLGNMLILVGPELYNKYSYNLVTNPLLPVAEIGLVVLFLVHIYFTICLTIKNRKARMIPPSRGTSGEKGVTFASKTMILTGLLTLVFVVLHLITFKYGTHYEVTYNGIVMRNIYRLVIEKFHEPLYVGWYLLCLVVLGAHLSHGVSALFQSLGLVSSRNCTLRTIAWVFAILVAGGFISQPLYVVLTGGKPS